MGNETFYWDGQIGIQAFRYTGNFMFYAGRELGKNASAIKSVNQEPIKPVSRKSIEKLVH